jgi:cysteine-rich repeat protein
MRTNKTLVGLAIVGLIAGGACTTRATDIGVAPTKLIVVDKLAASNNAKAVFVAKDALVDKGAGTDPATIAAELQMSYDNGVDSAITGEFDVPMASANWVTNKAAVAKFVNKDAPTGTGTKVAVIKQNNLVKLVGKNLGDSPLDILSQSASASGAAKTAYCVQNGVTANCFCSNLDSCSWKSIAKGTGAKLVCKGGTADPSCGGITTRCAGGAPNDALDPGEQCDDGDANDGNGCTKTCTLCGSPGGGGSVLPPLQCQTTKTCKTKLDGTPCSDDSDCAGGFCTTNNIPGCDANCTLPACGNGNVSGAETCDDGNTSNFDSCPSNCIIDSCTNPGGSYSISVNFAGSEDVAGITIFIDYPEGSVILPGSGSDATALVTNLPGSAGASANDYDHAVQVAVADFAAFPSGLLFNLGFQSCNGASPAASEFTCTVLSAGDAALAPISGVTCSVTHP